MSSKSKPLYFTLEDFLDKIDEPNKTGCLKLYEENKTLINSAKGSKIKHQAWVGGYKGHITDCMNVASRIYNTLSECRPLPFSKSDTYLILFLHDLEKPWKYSENEADRAEFAQFEDYQEFIKSKIAQYGIQLTGAQENALKYIHGEGDDYNPDIKIQNELSAFVHCCDTMSARIWYDHPKNEEW